jgi:hypothetical protein
MTMCLLKTAAIALAALTLPACVSSEPEPKNWSLFMTIDDQDYFVAEKLTHRECMRFVYQVDRWTNGAANHRCEQVAK